MNTISLYSCYIYIALWMIYYLQWSLGITGFLAQSILLIVMAMSFYAFWVVNIFYKTPPYIKWLNVMLIILTVYGMIPILGGWTLAGSYKVGASWMTYLYLQNIYMSIFPIYAFYYFFLKNQIADSHILYLYVLYLVFSILMFYQDRAGNEEVTNNAGYYFVPLIPMLGLLRTKVVFKYLALGIVLAYLMASMKRGAILTGGVLAVLFLVHSLRNVPLKRSIPTAVLFAAVLYVIYHFSLDLYVNNYFFNRTK